MVAYLDLIILENFCMNFLILYTTGKLLNRKLKRIRLLIASVIGDLYTFLLYINVPSYVVNISKIAMAILLVKISFGSGGIKNIFKESLVFLMVSFIYAGCALGFIYFAKPKIIYIVNGVIIGGEYIFELVLGSAIISFVLIKVSMKLVKLKQRFSKDDMICRINIINDDKEVKLNALLDTGNLLSDPVTGEPVVIVEFNKIKNLFSKTVINKFEYMMGGGKNYESDDYDTNVRIIPYVSVGNSTGVMFSCKVDCVKVEYHGEINVINNVLIGFSRDALTKNNKYSALIGLKILERENDGYEPNTDIKNKGKYSVC